MSARLSAGPIRSLGVRWRPDPVIRSAWPIVVCTAALPIMFLVGLHGLIWAVPGVVLSLRLLRRPATRIPGSALLLLVALAWMAASVLRIDAGGLPLFAYRWILFLGAFAAEVWLMNTSEARVPTDRVVRWLASLWIAMVGLGLAAIFVSLDMPSPLLRVLPHAITNIDFFESISAWRLAEVQGFLGFPLPRPAAPFPAANGWGSAMGLLAPFFISSWIVDARGVRRQLGFLVAAVAVIPIIYSFNRGLWLSIAVCVGYVAVRQLLRGRVLALVMLAGFALALVAALTVSPLGDLANEKVETAGDSNDSRSEVYDEALAGAKESPLLGNGAPVVIREGLPPAGTHGMIWYLLFVHGFIATGLYLGWLGLEIFRSAPSRSPGSLWFHTSLIIAGLQTLFYGMLPQVVLVGIVAGLAQRAARQASTRETVGGQYLEVTR